MLNVERSSVSTDINSDELRCMLFVTQTAITDLPILVTYTLQTRVSSSAIESILDL